jgi:hypothetical protein
MGEEGTHLTLHARKINQKRFFPFQLPIEPPRNAYKLKFNSLPINVRCGLSSGLSSRRYLHTHFERASYKFEGAGHFFLLNL